MNWNYYYYADQTGAGGIDYMPFRGTVLQSGYGTNFRYYNQKGRGRIGDMFKSLIKWVSPILKKAQPYISDSFKSVGKQALNTVSDIAQDVASGKNVSDVAKAKYQATRARVKKGARELGKEGLRTVAGIATDMIPGDMSLQESATNQISQAAENLSNKLNADSARQKGQGIKRKKTFKKYVILKKAKKANNTKYSDIFSKIQ